MAERLRAWLLFAVALTALAFAGTAQARKLTDSAGRSVEIPDRVERVMAAGPPASVLVYVLAPDKLIGWNRKPTPEELPYLAPVVRNLPEIGRLTGRGNTTNLEVVLAAKPDLIVDFGSVNPTYVSLADRVQSQTGIPYVLMDGRFPNTAAVLRSLGEMIGAGERAERLARHFEETLKQVDDVVASVPVNERPKVYLARGPRGLETARRGGLNAEIIERAGAVNVVNTGQDLGSIFNVSAEQVLAWNPDTIVTLDRMFYDSVGASPIWQSVDAVKRKRIYLSPSLPYGWIDAPPSLNRLIGLQWMAHIFFPTKFPGDIRAVARDFYKLFYQVDLGDAELDRLLAGAKGGN